MLDSSSCFQNAGSSFVEQVDKTLLVTETNNDIQSQEEFSEFENGTCTLLTLE